MNLMKPREKLKSGNPPALVYPATLSVAEAVDTLKTSLAGMMKPAETGFPKLPQIHIKVLRFVLVYGFPFGADDTNGSSRITASPSTKICCP